MGALDLCSSEEDGGLCISVGGIFRPNIFILIRNVNKWIELKPIAGVSGWVVIYLFISCFQMVSELKDHLLRHLQGVEKKKIEQMVLDYSSKLVGFAFCFLFPKAQVYNS